MKNFKVKVKNKTILTDYNAHFSNLVEVSENVLEGVLQHYKKAGLTYVDVPAIVGITGACENVDTLFKVQNRSNLPLFFTQTGQLALEQVLQSCHGACTIIHSGRDEEEEDFRHLRQFRLTEEEFDCTMEGMTRENYDEEKMFKALLLHIQETVQSIVEKTIKSQSRLLTLKYKRDVKPLEKILRKDFYQINYEEAIELLNKYGFPNLVYGEDLKSSHEAKIVSLLNKKGEETPVFITRYPKEIKFFNMKVSSKDPRVVLSADLIFPYAGEGAGSAVREHNFEKLNKRLLTSNMYRLHVQRGGKYEDFKWYLDIIKNKKSYPHAGYGIGNERVIQYIFAESDIRNVSIFSLLNRQTGDWDNAKRGRLSFYSHKRNILLSIGRITDKKALLEDIMKLKDKDYFLYATEKTHGFLLRHKIKTALVHKISEHKKPNIKDLLDQKIFDIIVNIPKHPFKKSKEHSDGSLIRKRAVESGITLATDVYVAKNLLDKLVSEETDVTEIEEKAMRPTLNLDQYRHISHVGSTKVKPSWVYDINKSYDWNYEKGPFFSGEFPIRSVKPAKKFLNFSVNSLFGVPAGPLLNSQWVELYSKLGFDILTYKTVRTTGYSAHPMPHILYVEKDGRGDENRYKFVGKPYFSQYDSLTITNSFGVPSKDPDVWQEDIRNSLKVLNNGQVLIVSVMGTHENAKTKKDFVNDFARCAGLAADVGSPIIEVNLSCPNLHGSQVVCYDVELSESICRQIKNTIGDIPLIAKIGYFEDDRQLRDLVIHINKYVSGISAINTVRGQIKDTQAKKVHMRNLKISGVCGNGIKPYGIDMVKRLYAIRQEWKMDFVITGVGGVTTPQDYEEYIDVGADAVQSATGAMTDPLLAHKIYEKESSQKRDYQTAKSIGETFFHNVSSTLALDELKKMYLQMIFPKTLPENKQTLLIRDVPFKLKHGERGRRHSHIYMNHRNPLFVNAWDRRFLVELFDAIIRERILKNGEFREKKYGVIAVSSSSSPELTAAMLDALSSFVGRAVMLPHYFLSKEQGAHQQLYGELDSGKPWILIDDVFTSGKTLQKAIKYIPYEIKNMNDRTRLFAVTMTCRNPEREAFFTKQTGCDLFYLASLKEALEYHWGRFTPRQKRLILKEREELH